MRFHESTVTPTMQNRDRRWARWRRCVSRGLGDLVVVDRHIEEFGFAFVKTIQAPFLQQVDGQLKLFQVQFVEFRDGENGFVFQRQNEGGERLRGETVGLTQNESSGFFDSTHK